VPLERTGAAQCAQHLEDGRAPDLELGSDPGRAVAVVLSEARDDQSLAVATEQEVGDGVLRTLVATVVGDLVRLR